MAARGTGGWLRDCVLMAKAPKRRLKVFQAQFGFHDSVVAAPSQAAALHAWGTRQNLFADGQAVVATDPDAVAAALAHPDTPLRRPVGSTVAYELNPTVLPQAPETPKRAPAPKAATKPAEPAPPPADRSALDAAEAALRERDAERKREEAALRKRQDDLDAARATAQAAYVADRKAATAAIVEARQAYRAAGGKD